MPKIAYKVRDFKPAQLELIAKINVILGEYRVKITLRQLYYRLVVLNIIDNNKGEYDKLGNLVGEARLAGYIDWEAMEDRVRFLQGEPVVEGPRDAMENMLDVYAHDLWWDQPIRPEVWVEKDSQSGIVGAICLEERVNFFVARGYASLSAYYEAGQRLRGYIEKGQTPVVLHLGDHDPSGLDMTRDITEKLALFTGVKIVVHRIALNIDQIYKYSMPANPAKVTDSRAAAYINLYGDTSWELDAFPPDDLQKMLRREISLMRDNDLWSDTLAEEVEDKSGMKELIKSHYGDDE